MSQDLQLLSVILQALVTCIFIGSFFIAYHNLRIFRQNHNAMVLKTVMNDYKKLVADEVFDKYPEELESWKYRLLESDFSPTMAYYNQLGIISRIGSFYDYVGMLLQKGLLDFDLCFEMVPFPYKFWEDTQEFRKIMKQATYAEFWDFFESLHNRYRTELAKRQKPHPLEKLLRKRPKTAKKAL